MAVDKLYINVFNLENLGRKKQLKDFAIFLHLKSKFNNSCYFKYSHRQYAKDVGLSVNTARKYVKMFVDRGWCRWHHGNLVFNRLRQFNENPIKKILPFNVMGGIQKIYEELCYEIMIHKQMQHEELIKVNADHKSPRNLEDFKIAKKIIEKRKIKVEDLPGVGDRMKLSVKRIASMFGCSAGSAVNMIKRLKKRGVVWCINRGRQILSSKCKRSVWEALNIPGTYYHNGVVFKVFCNEYVVMYENTPVY